MQKIAISNQKGGVGKSTVAVHLAMSLYENGKKVLFVDLDPQANATKTLGRAASSAPIAASQLFSENIGSIKAESLITLIHADELMADIERSELSVLNTFKHNIDAIGQGFDYCVIDTPPTLGLRMTAALLVANHVLSPIELEEYSIDGIAKMLQTIFNVKDKWNPDLNFLGMLPNRFNPRSVAQKETLSSLISDYSHLLIKDRIGIRSSIPEAMSKGVPVWQLKKSSAREAGKEFKKAIAAVCKKMEEPVC